MTGTTKHCSFPVKPEHFKVQMENKLQTSNEYWNWAFSFKIMNLGNHQFLLHFVTFKQQS